MKNILLIIVLLALTSCNNAENKTVMDKEPVFEVNLLEGYFPKNDIAFNAPVKTIVISKKEDFDNYFGIAQTMENKVSEVDFDKNKILALISAPSDKEQKIVITNTNLKNNKLQVKYKLEIGEENQSFTSTDLKLFPIPKSVNAVDFIIDRDEL